MNSREIALNILLDIKNNEGYSNITINKHMPADISKQDESFIRELVYGVLENGIYIDYILRKASKIRLKKIHVVILEILRIGIYQLVFMDRIPVSAAVNEAVNLAKKYGNKGSIGFTNGILRAIGRDKENFMRIDSKDKEEYLSIKYSHPLYLVKKFIEEFGYESAEKLLIANNSKPELNLRVNTLKTDRLTLRLRLEDKGFLVREGSLSADALIVENPFKITELNEFKQGLFTIQDESSQLVAHALDPEEGSFVVDVCAAPGGKSTHIAQLMKNKGIIVSRDIHDHKIKLINSNAKRLGADIIKAESFDSTKTDEELKGKADYVLVDAPCSGLGLIRRKPEIKWNRNEEDFKALSDLQMEILQASKDYLKPGGTLLYSTCTIIDEENRAVVKRFLDSNADFKLVPINKSAGSYKNTDGLFIQLYPHIHNTDGFFIAKMVKEG